MLTRRYLLQTAGAGAALAVPGLKLAEAAGAGLTPGVPEGVASYATMATLPGKKPLIQLSDRPPNYEAPLEYLRTPITPNDEFYVRYHLSDIPTVNAESYKIAVGGDGANGTDRDHIRRSEEDAGDRSGCGQSVLGQSARAIDATRAGRRMGLRRHGLRALEGSPDSRTCSTKSASRRRRSRSALNGADGPAINSTPDFIKSIPVWKAVDPSRRSSPTR